MKKALAFILCVLLISGSVTLRFGSEVKKTADKVEFTEEVLLGDPKEAEGLHVSFVRERANPYAPSKRKRCISTAMKIGQPSIPNSCG